MKKILALILAAVMLLTLAACGKTNTETPSNPTENTTTSNDSTEGATTPDNSTEGATTPDDSNDSATTPDDSNDSATTPDDSNDSATTPDDSTENTTPPVKVPTKEELAAGASVEAIAKAQLDKYVEFAGIRAQYDEYIASLEATDEKMPYEEFLSYQVICAAVEKNAEYLTGFNAVPTGYSEAYYYQPSMMGQAFIGYIFRVADGTNVETFKASLKENCFPRWNWCTEANTVVCESYGNLVYFTMMVVATEDNPYGFTAQQKDDFYNTFVATIENSAK